MSNRRDFLRQSVLATASLSLFGCGGGGASENTAAVSPSPAPASAPQSGTSAAPTPYLDAIGIQLWTVRNQMAEDPATTLRTLAEIGYRQVELMDTRDIVRLKPLCDEYGLAVNSSFLLWTTLTGRWDLVPDEPKKFEFAEVVDQAAAGGLSHLVFGYLQPGERQTADDWKRRADELNRAGERARAADLQLTYHNHNFEWDAVEGTTGFDILRERLEPELVPFELDVAWVAVAGRDPREVLTSIRDRVELLHLKNIRELDRPYLTLPELPDDTFTELPHGQLNAKALLDYAAELGVTYCFYEQDNNWHPDALGSARTSLDYLRS